MVERDTPRGDSRAVGDDASRLTRLSVVIPMLNESAHVQHLVADLAAQDFPGEVEILVADGGSTDGSLALLEAAARRAGLAVTLIENRARWVAPGLNACIGRATGELIVRLDCHTRYAPDYLRRCAEVAAETGAWNVGPVGVPLGRTPLERAVACAMDGPFGGIHWSRHDGAREHVDVDTVYLGAFRAEAFTAAGLFDESLNVTEDEDLNLRIRKAGGRVVLDPALRVGYIPEGSFRRIFRKYYYYGLWKVPVMLKHRQVVSGRSVVPIAFVGSLLVLGPAAVRSGSARVLLMAEMGVYASCAVVFAAASIRRRAEPWWLLPAVVAVFPAFHIGYGLGMLRGLVRATTGRPWPRPSSTAAETA